MRYQSFVAIAIALLAPAGARAQEAAVPGNWNVSPAIGVALDPDARASLVLTGAFGYDLTADLTLEVEVSHIFDRVPDDADVDSRLTTVSASLLHHFGGGRLRPYLAGGIGAGWFLHQVQVPPGEVSDTAFALNLGAGAAWTVSARVRVRGDFRYFNYVHGTSSDAANLVIVEDVPSAWRFTGGVTIRLGQ